jgi:hypothetical protein
VSVWLYQRAALHINRSKGPVQSAEQPADSERHDGSCVRLSFNAVPQPGIERGRSLSSGVSRLTVKILCGAGRLIHETFGFCLRVTGGATDSLLNRAAEVSGRSLQTILIHGYSRLSVTLRLSERSAITTSSTELVCYFNARTEGSAK